MVVGCRDTWWPKVIGSNDDGDQRRASTRDGRWLCLLRWCPMVARGQQMTAGKVATMVDEGPGRWPEVIGMGGLVVREREERGIIRWEGKKKIKK